MRIFLFLILAASRPALAGPAELAPPPFKIEGQQYVFVDVRRANFDFEFDVANKKGIGRATLVFYSRLGGYPVLDLVPAPSLVRLNGLPVDAKKYAEVTTPDGATMTRALQVRVRPRSFNVVRIEYPLTPDVLTFSPTGINTRFWMSDISKDRKFLEKFAPANFEYDQFEAVVTARVLGAKNPHRAFSNGWITTTGVNAWRVVFPRYFTSSSFFIHFTETKLFTLSESYQGKVRSFPLTVYGEKKEEVDQALVDAKNFVKELEGLFGPWSHPTLLIYVTKSAGGMEYAGAAMAQLKVLGHLLAHSWFGRSLIPANGNAAWMDEALVSWYRGKFPRAKTLAERVPVQMADFSPYRRRGNWESFKQGSWFLGEIDLMLADKGGLLPHLSRWYLFNRNRPVTTDQFEKFLTTSTGLDLQPRFTRYVRGKP